METIRTKKLTCYCLARKCFAKKLNETIWLQFYPNLVNLVFAHANSCRKAGSFLRIKQVNWLWFSS